MKLTLNIGNKKLLKKILAISLPVFVVGASITTYLVKTNKDKDSQIVNNNVTINNGVKRQVYLLTNDNLLMPVTITKEKQELLADEISDLVNLLKEDSNLVNENLNYVLTKDCTLKNVTIEDKLVTLNFNKEFNYDAKNERRVIESLVWTCLQFDEVDSLKIQIEDNDITHMPLNNTPIPVSLNKNIGINSHLMVGNTNQRSVNVFYEKTIDDNSYFIPVTVKVNDYENDYEEIVNGMNFEMPIYTSLSLPNVVSRIEVLEYNNLDDNNNLNLTLSSKALYDEKTIDNKVFDYLVMNLMFNDELIETVSITVNDEIINVNGYEKDVVEVSNVTFNEMKV